METLNGRIRRVAPDGTIDTVVGTLPAASAQGPAAFTRLLMPAGVAIDSRGDLLVVDKGARSVLKRNALGQTELVVPTSTAERTKPLAPRPLAELTLNRPGPIAIDS